MFTSSVFAFLHFLAAFGVLTTIVLERVLIKQNLSIPEANRIRKIDALYGISALLVLIIGFLRVFYFEKGSTYYFSNPMFHVKLTLFAVIGILSIYPTVRFMKWKKIIKTSSNVELSQSEYSRIRRILNLELALFVIMLFSASLMAKHVTFF